MRLGILFSGLAALAFSGLALAAETALAPFAGQWVGKATVETQGPTDFPASVRDVGVTLTEDGAGGFKIEWSTVKRESGDPMRPDETASDTEVDFVPAGEGRWAAAPADPTKGSLWYARVEDQNLIINGFTVTADGKSELQTYVRTIEDGTMGLVYIRVVDGAVMRRASGTLTRFAP
jgi:hypothetical protein